MNDKYSDAVVVTLVRSRLTAAFVVLASAATLGVLALTPLPLAARILAATGVLCSALRALRNALRTPTVLLDSSGQISVNGQAGRVRAGSFVAPFLTIVRWRPHGCLLDRSLLIAPDCLGDAQLRHLRVLVKWGQTLYSQPSDTEVPIP